MSNRLVRVFSSATNLEEYGEEPFMILKVTERAHVLDSGCDYFDEKDVPVQPPPQTLKKNFSGSLLDLDEQAEILPEPHNNDSTNEGFNGAKQKQQQLQSFESRGTVALIGGSHFLNGHIVGLLLERGYNVHVFVQDLRANASVASELYAIAGKNSDRRLVVGDADMYDGASLREALRRSSCRFVIHGGVNVVSTVSPQRTVEMHRAAVLALFEAARSLRSGTLERIVVTSSMASLFHNSDKPPEDGGGFNEDCFNKKSTAAEEPIPFAKAHFESEVWRLQKASTVDVSVVVPSIMLGPSRTSESSDAMRLVCDFAQSSSYFPFAPSMYWNFVDVRDVAQAHILALESDRARNRRYIVSSDIMSLAELGQMIRKANNKLKAPVYNMPWILAMIGPLMPGSRVRFQYLWNNLGVRRPLTHARAEKELSFKARPMEETVKDCIVELTEQNLLPEATGAVDADWEMTKHALMFGAATSAVVGGVVWWWKRKYQKKK